MILLKFIHNHRYLVANHENNTDVIWWNSEDGQAAHIDFTKSEAVSWFTQRLRKLQEEAGIDSFKFDAGETLYFPKVNILFLSFYDKNQ